MWRRGEGEHGEGAGGMRDVTMEGSRGSTHFFVSSLFGFCVRLLHQICECILVRELKAGTVNRKGQLAPLGDEISTPSTPGRSSQTKFSAGTWVGVETEFEQIRVDQFAPLIFYLQENESCFACSICVVAYPHWLRTQIFKTRFKQSIVDLQLCPMM